MLVGALGKTRGGNTPGFPPKGDLLVELVIVRTTRIRAVHHGDMLVGMTAKINATCSRTSLAILGAAETREYSGWNMAPSSATGRTSGWTKTPIADFGLVHADLWLRDQQ
jgi:hypothetical protein